MSDSSYQEAKFQLITSKTIEAINSDYYDLIIVDYQIVDGNKERVTDNIKNSLSSLDKGLTQLYNTIIGKKAVMFLTSCYGINEALYNNKEELVNVNFSKKVPFVIVDNDKPSSIYQLQSGNLSDLSTTIINYLEIPPMQGMTGRNLLVSSPKKKGKNSKKTSLILIVFFIIIIAAIAAMYFLKIL